MMPNCANECSCGGWVVLRDAIGNFGQIALHPNRKSNLSHPRGPLWPRGIARVSLEHFIGIHKSPRASIGDAFRQKRSKCLDIGFLRALTRMPCP